MKSQNELKNYQHVNSSQTLNLVSSPKLNRSISMLLSLVCFLKPKCGFHALKNTFLIKISHFHHDYTECHGGQINSAETFKSLWTVQLCFPAGISMSLNIYSHWASASAAALTLCPESAWNPFSSVNASDNADALSERYNCKTTIAFLSVNADA